MQLHLHSNGDASRLAALHHGLQRMSSTRCLVVVGLILATAAPHAQNPSARVAILLAEERGAPDARDLATLRAGTRNADGETARAAIRALGRLRRPALVADIAVALKSRFPELRAEAADAIGSAFAGLTAGFGATSSASSGPTAGFGGTSSASAGPTAGSSGGSSATSATATAAGRQPATTRAASAATVASVASALSTLLARLTVETEPSVRAAICEALGRIPYTDTSQIVRAEGALLSLAHSEFVTDRLGVVKGFESMIRMNVGRWSPSVATIAMLRELVGVSGAVNDRSAGVEVPPATLQAPAFPARDARIRRLAFEALMTAGEVDRAVIERGAGDPDSQVRWLTMRAAGAAQVSEKELPVSILRSGLTDPQSVVRLEALRAVGTREHGSLQACQHFIDGLRDLNTQVVLLALDLLGDCGAYPNAAMWLEYTVTDSSAVGSPRGWHRAAHALVALSRAAPDRATAVLGRFTASSTSHLRAYAARAAIALNDRVTLERLADDVDDRVAQIAAEGLGRTAVRPSNGKGSQSPQETDLTAGALHRLAAPKARVTIRGVGTFELALFTSQAPAAVLRFARLAESGEFNGALLGGVTRTLVNLMPQAAVGRGDVEARRIETGPWPHVRGAVGLASGGPEIGGTQIFIDLVDNPRFDHHYPVFAQVLNGIDLIDQILEGDIIEKIEIIAGP